MRVDFIFDEMKLLTSTFKTSDQLLSFPEILLHEITVHQDYSKIHQMSQQ